MVLPALALSAPSRTQTLYLDGNAIGDAGAKQLVQLCEQNQCLQHLWLGDNGITAALTDRLMNSLRIFNDGQYHFGSLTTLVLTGNEV